MSLCAYKDILGIPNEGLHKYRVANIAIVDVLLTIALAWILAKLFKVNYIIILLLLS